VADRLLLGDNAGDGAVMARPIRFQCVGVWISADSFVYVGRDSSVGIATGCGLDGPGIESRWEARFSTPVETSPGAHPASYTIGTGSFPGVKRPGRGLTTHPI